LAKNYNLSIDINFTDSYKSDLQKLENNLNGIKDKFEEINTTAKKIDDAVGKGTKQASNELKALDKRLEYVEKQMNSLNKENKDLATVMKKQGDSVDGLSKDYKQLEKQLEDTQKEVKDLNKENDKLKSDMNNMGNQVDKTSKKMSSHTSATKDATNATTSFQSRFSETLRTAVRSTAIWGLATTAVYGTKRALEEVSQAIIEVDRQMVGVQKVMGDRVSDFQEMERASANLGKEYAQTMPKVLEQMEEWGRQGKEQNEVIQLTEASLLSANATNIQSADAVRYLVSAMTQFNIKAEDSIMIVDMWNEVANNFANTTAMDLAEAMKEAGKPADALGIQINELIGLTTAMAEATAKSGNRLGRSLRTVLANMAETTGGMEDYINGFEEWLATAENVDGEEIDISLRSSEGEYRNLFEVLGELSDEWENLTQKQKLSVSNLAGNKRRYSDFLALIENFDTALNSSATALGAFGSALEENRIYMESVQAQFDQARVAFESLSNTIGNRGGEDALKSLANGIENVMVFIEDMIVGFQDIKELAITGLSLSVFATALANITTLIKGASVAMSAFTNVLMINPYITAFVGLATAIGLVSRSIGKAKREAEEYEKINDTLNAVLQSNADMSYNQAIAVKKSVNEYEETITKLNQVNSEINTMEKLLAKSGGVTRHGFESASQKYNRMLESRARTTREFVEEAKKLPSLFPKIADGTLQGADAYDYAQERLDELNRKIMESIDFTKDMNSYAGKTGDAFAESAFEAGKAIKNEIIDKLIDLESTLNETFDTEKVDIFLAKMQKSAGLLSNLEYENAILKAQQQQVNAIENVFTQTYMMQDQAKGGKIDRAGLIKDLTSRIEDPNSTANKDVLRKIRQEVENMEEPMVIWSDLMATVSDELKNAYNELYQMENQYENIKNLSEFEKGESNIMTLMGGIGSKSLSELTKLEGEIETLIDKGKELGEGTNALESALAEIQNAIDVKEFAEDKNNFIENTKELMNTPANSIEDVAKLIDKGKDRLQEAIERGYSTGSLESWLNSLKEGNEIAKQFVRTASNFNSNGQGNSLQSFWDEGDKLRSQGIPKDVAEIQEQYWATQELINEGQNRGYGTRILEAYAEKLRKALELNNAMAESEKAVADATARRTDIQERYNEYLSETTSESEQIRQQREELRNILEETTDSRYREQLEEIIGYLGDELSRIAQEQRDNNFADEINSSLEKTGRLLDKLDVDNLLGIGSKEDAISQLKNRLNTLQSLQQDVFNKMSRGLISSDVAQEQLKELGLNEKQIKDIMKKLNKEIKSTKTAWGVAIGSGISEALDSSNVNGFGERIGLAIRATLSNILADDDLKAGLEDMTDGMGEMLAESLGKGKDFGDAVSLGLMSGFQSFAKGGSVGASLLSGAGSALTAMSNPIGGVLSGISMIGQSLWGDVEGEEWIGKVDEANKKQAELNKTLKEFGLQMQTVHAYTVDTASSWDSFWGGADYEPRNLDKANDRIEEMKERLEDVSSIFKDMGNKLGQSLKSATSYSEFAQHFKEGIGQALQDALIQSMITQGAVEEGLKQLTSSIFTSTQDGSVTDRELAKIEQTYNQIMGDMEGAYSVIADLNDSDFMQDVDANVDNSYSAGSTTNITYHQQFVVETGAMMGDEADAEEFSRVLEPYIREVIEREAGA